MTMLEKIAEKISDELVLHKQGLDWQDPDGPIQRTARAVLTTMREPTDEMIREPLARGVSCDDRFIWPGLAKEIWTAMIDAALAEK